MPPDETDLAALTGSRICHDLASPIGAALTGLDFLSGAAGTSGPEEMALLRDSLTGARATLEILRTAFGRAGAGGGCDAATLGAAARGHLSAWPRLRLDWALDGPLSRTTARHLVLSVLCAAQALPRGGTLAVNGAEAQGLRVTATAEDGLAADPSLWDGLTGRGRLPAPDPRRAEFHLLAAHVARGTARIEVTRDAQSVAIAVLPPAQD